jgi:hypothetical protein
MQRADNRSGATAAGRRALRVPGAPQCTPALPLPTLPPPRRPLTTHPPAWPQQHVAPAAPPQPGQQPGTPPALAARLAAMSEQQLRQHVLADRARMKQLMEQLKVRLAGAGRPAAGPRVGGRAPRDRGARLRVAGAPAPVTGVAPASAPASHAAPNLPPPHAAAPAGCSRRQRAPGGGRAAPAAAAQGGERTRGRARPPRRRRGAPGAGRLVALTKGARVEPQGAGRLSVGLLGTAWQTLILPAAPPSPHPHPTPNLHPPRRIQPARCPNVPQELLGELQGHMRDLTLQLTDARVQLDNQQ